MLGPASACKGCMTVIVSGCALCESQGFRPEGLLHNHSLLSHPPTESDPVGGAMQVNMNDHIPMMNDDCVLAVTVTDGDNVLAVS